MSLTLKNRSTAKRTLLLWMILLSPLIGVATYMVASHYGLDGIAAGKLTAAVVAVWWMLVFAFTRLLSWRARRHA